MENFIFLLPSIYIKYTRVVWYSFTHRSIYTVKNFSITDRLCNGILNKIFCGYVDVEEEGEEEKEEEERDEMWCYNLPYTSLTGIR
jgi:hypothetical protein